MGREDASKKVAALARFDSLCETSLGGQLRPKPCVRNDSEVASAVNEQRLFIGKSINKDEKSFHEGLQFLLNRGLVLTIHKSQSHLL